MKILVKLIIFSFMFLIFITPVFAATNDQYIYQYLTPQNIPGSVQDLKDKLDSEAVKIVNAGHLVPFRAMYGEGYGTTGQYYWYHRYDSVYTLSLMYPYLTSTTQNIVKTYLTSEIANYPPWTTTLLSTTVGAKRQPDQLTAAEFGTIPTVYNNRPKLFALYALWLYAQNTGDWNTINTNSSAIKTFYSNNKAEVGKYYTSIAGAIGMARIAHHQTDATFESGVVTDITAGLTAGKNFSTFGASAMTAYQYDSGENQTYTLNNLYQGFQFLDISPEIGRYMADDPTLSAAIVGQPTDLYSVSRGEFYFPLWWMAESPMGSVYFGESSGNPPDTRGMLFPYHVWIKKDSVTTLRSYLDVPDALIGDDFYLQNIARTIEAAGQQCWTDVRTNASTCAKAGDFDGNGVVDSADIKFILSSWFAPYNSLDAGLVLANFGH